MGILGFIQGRKDSAQQQRQFEAEESRRKDERRLQQTMSAIQAISAANQTIANYQEHEASASAKVIQMRAEESALLRDLNNQMQFADKDSLALYQARLKETVDKRRLYEAQEFAARESKSAALQQQTQLQNFLNRLGVFSDMQQFKPSEQTSGQPGVAVAPPMPTEPATTDDEFSSPAMALDGKTLPDRRMVPRATAATTAESPASAAPEPEAAPDAADPVPTEAAAAPAQEQPRVNRVLQLAKTRVSPNVEVDPAGQLLFRVNSTAEEKRIEKEMESLSERYGMIPYDVVNEENMEGRAASGATSARAADEAREQPLRAEHDRYFKFSEEIADKRERAKRLSAQMTLLKQGDLDDLELQNTLQMMSPDSPAAQMLLRAKTAKVDERASIIERAQKIVEDEVAASVKQLEKDQKKAKPFHDEYVLTVLLPKLSSFKPKDLKEFSVKYAEIMGLDAENMTDADYQAIADAWNMWNEKRGRKGK